MREVGTTRSHGGGRPRPLGQVKSESLHFNTANWVPTRPLALLPVPVYPVYPVVYPHSTAGLHSCHSEDGLRASIKSMRDLQESLRHAALLNIVASANSENSLPEDPPPKDGRAHGPGTTPPQLAAPSSPKKRSPSPLALQVTGCRGSPFPQNTESGGRSAGSRTYHMPHRDSGGSPSPQTLVAKLLSPRIRTISIPRPSPQACPDLPGPFIHKSVSLAKDCLAKVGLTVKPRGEATEEEEEGNEEGSGGGKTTAAPTPRTHDVSLLKVSGMDGAAVPGLLLTARGQSLEKPHLPNTAHTQEKSPLHHPNTASTNPASESAGSSGNLPSAQSRSTAITITSTTMTHSASVTSDSGRSPTEGRSAATGKTETKAGEERSGATLHVRRHLTPGKKRELVMRLSEMAKSEAVDMTHPLARGKGADTPSMPHMIIMSQQRLQQQRLEDSLAEGTVAPPPSQTGMDVELYEGKQQGGGVHRTKSLSSLIASNNYNYSSRTRARLPVHKDDDVIPDVTNLQRAHSGSMPDLVGEGDSIHTKSATVSDDTTNTESLFTNGIVGKTIGRDGEGGGKAGMESRPLPAIHTVRPRHGRRHSGRRSSLRDCGPIDPPPLNVTTFTSTTVLSLTPATTTTRPLLRSNSFTTNTTAAVPSSEQSGATSPALPVLTITGLQKEKTSTTSPASGRPSSRTSLNQRLQLFQQLDNQCEKLQRQLNISLTVPRRPPHWQHGPVAQAPPISRSDVSIHLQCVALGEGRGDRNTSTSLPSSSSHPLQLAPQRSAGVGKALNDVEEHSVQGGASQGMLTDITHPQQEDGHQEDDDNPEGDQHRDTSSATLQVKDRGSPAQTPTDPTSDKASDPTDVPTPGGARGETSAPSPAQPSSTVRSDPVLQTVKEPRYQGFSSKVSEHERRSQFHYVNPPSGLHEPHMPEEVREMKYCVLKALDQDVYYDFQHRKYRNSPANATAASPATPVSRCNNEEDRPRVHFYKVKVNEDT